MRVEQLFQFLWPKIEPVFVTLIVEGIAQWFFSYASRFFLWILSFAISIFSYFGKLWSEHGFSLRPSSSRRSKQIPELTVPEPPIPELTISESYIPESPGPEPHIPELPNNPMGLVDQVQELKRRLFEYDYNKVGVSAMGGSGKTTLAAALCWDPQVKKRFGNKIIFQKVSESPDIKKILESIWVGITGVRPVPNFQSIQDGRRRLKEWLSSKESQNILVVLDDVWHEDHLKELLFEAKGYKTVVTARHTYKWLDNTYDLPLLGEKDALSLFCFEAFGQKSIPDKGYNKALVKEVAGKCQGLPLALMVIGRSLYKENDNAYWEHARDKLSEGGPIDKSHEEEVLKLLAVSIEKLDADLKRCFLDLALFPGLKKVPVDTLFDIWIYYQNLKQSHARKNLLELERRRLLSLVNHNMGEHLGINEGSTCEQYIVQHDVLRNLAVYLANQPGNIPKRLRLVDPLCSWEKHSRAAEIIAIRTGSMNENQWPEVEFPKARALVLIFAGKKSVIPLFVQTMTELEVLIIINQNSVSTKLHGMSIIGSLTRLKSLRLEKLTVPPLQNHCRSLKNLRKLSLCLCRGDNEALDIQVCSQLNTLEEINVGHCVDIRELPDGICNLGYLKKLIITNCPELDKIPDNMGELRGSLVMLVLGACPELKILPDSICKLGKLELLDISECRRLEMLPFQFGNLGELQYLDMGECQKIRIVPKSAKKLTSLRRLICDEKLENEWSGLLPNLQLTIAESEHDLGWLEQ
ncbi:putative disease resistance protein At5g47280 [Cryptomeria japonica]|uniref:putative disease resistance protein At5g47280 n=1 Tax=Cryptomeria japonica TaxID=3369 RepID=UPI0027DA53D9|nr:putative disease resistance protein At5g47280 [Cryptomeria japonica]